ncbi:citrulline utilization hydrolase CtlX [Frigoribacterium sp. CFBP 13712]|uniref:citrulline utilization hydrolase CtlX n=1 Tax=Frigoribacterium sp. CFBP 13712 TaxID=2775309 RepID=UPI0018D60AD7
MTSVVETGAGATGAGATGAIPRGVASATGVSDPARASSSPVVADPEEARLARQSPAAVVMVRPRHFTPNPQTARDNAFQTDPADVDASRAEIAARARAEVDSVAAALRAAGVRVHLVDDERADRPDAVFPNNWFSTHSDGRLLLYPMHSPNRRAERRGDVVELLRGSYGVGSVVDHSSLESLGLHVEGTGALVFDHVERVAYVALSHRADRAAVDLVCRGLDYDVEAFTATDADGVPIYHTNVMMSVASRLALVGLEAIGSSSERRRVADRIAASGREVVALTRAQLAEFAGNALELRGADGPVLAVSARGWAALTPAQRATVARHARPLPLDVPTIELAGGSVRCMLAGVHLPAHGAVSGSGAR